MVFGVPLLLVPLLSIPLNASVFSGIKLGLLLSTLLFGQLFGSCSHDYC